MVPLDILEAVRAECKAQLMLVRARLADTARDLAVEKNRVVKLRRERAWCGKASVGSSSPTKFSIVRW